MSKLIPIDPRNPVASGFGWHVKVLLYTGLWPFVSEKRKFYYDLYTIFGIVFWLILYVTCQCAYFSEVSDIKDFAQAVFFLPIQGLTIPKNFYLYRNCHKIKACLEKLESELYLSKNSEEDKYVSTAIKKTVFFHRFGIFLCFLCIGMWINSVFAPGSERYTIVPAIFPFEYKHGLGFYVVLLYQICGTIYSATTYLTADTLYTGLLFQATAQVQRLCSILSKVGNEETDGTVRPSKAGSEKYAKVVACIEHHQDILRFCQQIQDCFKQITFMQIFVSLLALCMTEVLLLAFWDDNVFFMNVLPYFFTISFQVWQISYAGNELTYASKELIRHAYSSNFLKMDTKTRKVLITLMERFKRDITTSAGIVFDIPINLETFVKIMKTSYTYFAILKSVQEK